MTDLKGRESTRDDAMAIIVGSLKIAPGARGTYNIYTMQRSGKITVTAHELTELFDFLLREMSRIEEIAREQERDKV